MVQDISKSHVNFKSVFMICEEISEKVIDFAVREAGFNLLVDDLIVFILFGLISDFTMFLVDHFLIFFFFFVSASRVNPLIKIRYAVIRDMVETSLMLVERIIVAEYFFAMTTGYIHFFINMLLQ